MSNIDNKNIEITDEIYDIAMANFVNFAKENPSCTDCIYGGIEGGPGFLDFGQCDKHKEVHYGGKLVNPKECKDFIRKTDSELETLFITFANNQGDFYVQFWYDKNRG